MLGLVAAGRGGGDHGPPVFFTVPWSPELAARGGHLPGSIWQTLVFFRDAILPLIPDAHRLSDTGLFLLGLRLSRGDYITAGGYVAALRMLRELGLVRPAPD